MVGFHSCGVQSGIGFGMSREYFYFGFNAGTPTFSVLSTGSGLGSQPIHSVVASTALSALIFYVDKAGAATDFRGTTSVEIEMGLGYTQTTAEIVYAN